MRAGLPESGQGDHVCEEQPSRRRAGSRTTRQLLESRSASWETPRPSSRAPAPSRSPPPSLTHPQGRASPGLPSAPPPPLHTRSPTRGSSCRPPPLLSPARVLVLRLSAQTRPHYREAVPSSRPSNSSSSWLTRLRGRIDVPSASCSHRRGR